VELWLASVHVPGAAAERGRAAEEAGFDGISFGDTQHIAGDPFVGLALVGAATERLKLKVGVTNPVTRVAAVTAAAIATLQAESGGRAVLGIGRGDSSLGHLGRRPASVAATARFVEELQGYLRGEEVVTHDHRSQMSWILRSGQPKVPVDVAASGPRMLDVAARLADRVTINVGAISDRIAWAMDTVAAERAPAEPGADSALFGAYLVVSAHPDVRVARDLARGPLAAYAHFSGMPGNSVTRLTERDRAVVQAVAADYDLSLHGQRQARHVRHLTDEFVDRFGVVGTPERCASRLDELAELGLDRAVLVEGQDRAQPEASRRAHECLVEEVIPGLRAR
jgi:5,10-methylenetetrahydromethanopterin reductase